MGSSSSICTENIEQIEFLQKPLTLFLGFFRRRGLFYKQIAKSYKYTNRFALGTWNSSYFLVLHILQP